MSWASLASNQTVSCNNLQDAVNNSVFVLKNTIPSSNKEITASEAEYYVYINSITKTTTQLVVKSDLIAAPTTSNWAGGAVSDNGQYQTIINTSTGYLWESSDYGASWSQNTSAGSKGWRNNSISQTGSYRIAVTNLNAFVSSNGGSSFSTVLGSSSSFVGTAISDGGQYQWITLYGGFAYLSNDYGATFSGQLNAGFGNAWQYPSVSSSGQYVLLPDSNSTFGLKRSIDYGAHWTNVGSNVPYLTSAMSDSGQYQLTAQYPSQYISLSTDYGATFNQISTGSSYTKYFASAAMYASGEFMLIADQYNPTPGSGENGWVWRSSNYGSTFSKITDLGQANWQGVGFGGQYALAVSTNHVYRSTDYGSSWTEIF